MIRLAAECGLRRAEIAQVSGDDIVDDMVGRPLIVHGRGDKQRTVPLPDGLAAVIECANGYVYPGRWGGHVGAGYVETPEQAARRGMVRAQPASPLRHQHVCGRARPASGLPPAWTRLSGDRGTLCRVAGFETPSRNRFHRARLVDGANACCRRSRPAVYQRAVLVPVCVLMSGFIASETDYWESLWVPMVWSSSLINCAMLASLRR